MTTVYHPTLPISQEVEDAEPWVEQGWRKTKPAHESTAAATAEGKASEDKKGQKA